MTIISIYECILYINRRIIYATYNINKKSQPQGR